MVSNAMLKSKSKFKAVPHCTLSLSHLHLPSLPHLNGTMLMLWLSLAVTASREDVSGGAHFLYTLPHFRSPLPVPTSGVHFRCSLPVPTSGAHFPVHTFGAHFWFTLLVHTSGAHFRCTFPRVWLVASRMSSAWRLIVC